MVFVEDIEQMRIVDEIDDKVESSFNAGFDIVFDFLDDESACLVVHNSKYMEDEDELKEIVQSVFKNHNHTIEAKWDYDAGDEFSQSCDLDVKVVS